MSSYKNLPETVVYAGNVPPLSFYLLDLWRYRMLLLVFTLRDLKVRYTQTVLGFGWIVISPLITVGIFSFVFGLMIKIPSEGLPYLLFYLVAIVPWYAFMSMLNLTVGSVEGNGGLVTKIYFPRLLLGGSYVLSASVDYLVGFTLVIICAIFFGFLTIPLLVMLPFLLLLQALFAMGLGLFLAPLSTRYKDIKLFMPLIIQFYYFANPILYPVSAAPQWLRFWYDFNPMSMVIITYRNALRGEWPQFQHFSIGLITAMLTFMLGFWFFRKQEQSLVDSL